MPQAAAGSGSPPVAKELAVSSDAPRPRMGLVLDQTKGGTIKIKGFVSGGSAQQSGKLKEGDELVRVDGRAVTEMTVAQATDLIMNGFQAPHSSAAATPIKPVGQMTPPQGAKKHSGKPCGIGLTILDNPPHIVTYITPDGPAARSHAIEVGDTLVAINKELVADMEMDELVQRVVGEEGSVADLWLERIMPGGQSHNHHEKGDEIRAELSKLEMLLQDGVLDHATYTAGVEKCWRGCHSVRLVRGVAYTGDIEVAMQGEAAQRRQQTAGVVAAPLSETVVLEFYRPSLKKQVIVELPRPENVRPTQQKDLSPSRHPAHASTVSDPAAAAAADPAGAGGAANRDDAGLEKGVVATSNANGTGAPPSPGVTNGAKPAGGGKSPKDAGAAPARTQLAKLSALVQADEEMPSPSHTPYGVVGGGVESTAGVVSEAELSRHAARASAKPGKRSSLEMEQALMASIAQGTTPRRALDTALSGVADAAGERANDNAHRDNADKGVASPASPAADTGEPAVQVVAFVGSGSKIGLGIAQAKVGPAVMVSGLAPGGAAEQCAAIKVGDELLSVDGVGVRDRDIPAICAQIAEGANLHVTLTFAPKNAKAPRSPGGAHEPYSVVLPRPNHWDTTGASCVCPVCKRMRDVVGNSGNRRSSRGSRRSLLRGSLTPGDSSVVGSPVAEEVGEMAGDDDGSEGDGEEEEEEDEVPWWEKSRQLLDESAAKNQGNKGLEMGSMIIGGIFNLFSPMPSNKTQRKTPEELEKIRQDKLRKEQAELKKKIALWEAAEKLKQLLESKTVMIGDLCASDDTDTVLMDARYRPMLDAEDEEDVAWLHNQDEEGASQETVDIAC